MVMTDSPPPSDRPERASGAFFAPFWPVLFVFAAIGLTVCGLLFLHEPGPPAVTEQAQPPLVIAEYEPPPPPTASDFRSPTVEPSEPEPPTSDRYELALQLERGDTIEKMLSDIGVPDADRKQIADKLKALLKKNKLVTGETITLSLQTLSD